MGGRLFLKGYTLSGTEHEISPGGQIDSLIRLGMKIPDRESALKFVRHTGADVLREYLPPFQKRGGGEFVAGAQFADVAGLFAFDCELRMLVMGAAERIEVSVRAQMALRGALPAPQSEGRAVNATMGKLSWHYRKVLASGARRDIANVYGTDERILARFLHHLTIVRNLCAHNARLWNRPANPSLVLPVKKPAQLPFNHKEPDTIYNTLVLLVYMTDIVPPQLNWRARLSALLDGRGETTETAMGFPPGWRELEFWRR